jgi:peptide-methionine (R)-S-oxide reductase
MENIVSAIGRRELLGGGAVALAGLTFAGLANGQARPAAEIQLSNAEWRKRLGAQRFHILREAGTERPYSSPLNGEKRRGVFSCGGCGVPLFSSTTKFESGTGWPSFFRALPKAVITRADITSACAGQRFCAAGAQGISATSFQTARDRPDSAIA